jgi:uncharacterized protein YqgC (DUF456 family)
VVGVFLLCLVGVALSCLSLSGTWVVTGAAILAALIHPHPFPGIWTIVILVVIAGLVEVCEAFAGAWGVRRRGGSWVAGFAAMAGGLAGLVLGSMLIPIPVAGGLIGVVVGSFGLTFLVERHRLKKAEPAASIAFGAVLAHAAVVLIKVAVSLGMAAYLLFGMFRWTGYEAPPSPPAVVAPDTSGEIVTHTAAETL